MKFFGPREQSNILYLTMIIISIITIAIVLTFSVIGYRASYAMYLTNYPTTNITQNEPITFSILLKTNADINTTFKQVILYDDAIVFENTSVLSPQGQETRSYKIKNPGFVGRHRITLLIYDPMRDYDSYGSKNKPYSLHFNVNVKK